LNQVLLFTTHGLLIVFDFERFDNRSNLSLGKRIVLKGYKTTTFVKVGKVAVLDLTNDRPEFSTDVANVAKVVVLKH